MRWKFTDMDDTYLEGYLSTLNVDRTILKILLNRGIKGRDEIFKYLYGTMEHLVDSFEINEMGKGVDRVIQALENNERIIIWGDEDADGMTATAILYKFLKDIRANVSYFIPSRSEHGIGLNEKVIDYYADKGVNLIITVDCGISDVDEVDHANARGVDVIVTDHHNITHTSLPNAVARINPVISKNDKYSGAGVAFRFAEAIAKKYLNLSSSQFYSVQKDLVMIAAFGTIADKVPLVGDNRIIVKRGIEIFKEHGFCITKVISKLLDTTIIDNFQAIHNFIIPIISSSKSVKGKVQIINVLVSNDGNSYQKEIIDLYKKSSEWQSNAKEIFNSYMVKLDMEKFGKIIIIQGNTDRMYSGYVASKIKDITNKPVIIITPNNGDFVAEGRCPKYFDLAMMFKSMSDLFDNFGGHKYAAGFTIKKEKVSDFIERANRYAEENISEEDLVNNITIDAKIDIKDMSNSVFKTARIMSPFGEGNQPPVFLLNNVHLQEHIFGYELMENGIIFVSGDNNRCRKSINSGGLADIVFTVDIDNKPIVLDCKKIKQ
ncbi:DHH family phosphoesterase [candidate division WOR-3 bacterium]|nr:DHH family phosphoesterase [candidate division WOR-3 bacterium]